MDQDKLMKVGIAVAILYGVYKYAPQPWAKAMALGAAGVIFAKQVPYVNEALA
jgi:hypothetical protein